MHWKIKACLQRIFASLPAAVSSEIYYLAQRNFGSLRKVIPTPKMRTAVAICERIVDHERTPAGKKFVEVGTGRVPLVPLAYWLMGMDSCLTIDINRYICRELVLECVRYFRESPRELEDVIGDFMDRERFGTLMEVDLKDFSLQSFLQLCGIHYLAPADASALEVADEAVDFHTSANVLEHIRPDALRRILTEGIRVMSRSGLSIHRIDYTDHFSHQDKSISRINFLRYTDAEWDRYAGNRYMYMNRLRHDDFLCLFKESGHEIIDVERNIDEGLIELLKVGRIKLADRFADKPVDILATTGSWIVSRRPVND